MSKNRILSVLLTFLFFVFLTSFSFAREEKTSTSTAKLKTEYTLPYPGILPDNPLYPLKMLRDQIMERFITDPIKKAEYKLLMADKRLNSGVYLLDKGKPDLAEQTFSKGEKYLEGTLDETEKAQKAGRDTSALISKLSLATLKHKEVLTDSLEKMPESQKQKLQDTLTITEKIIERLQNIQGKKLEQILQKKVIGKQPGVSQVEAKEKQKTEK